MKAEAGDVVQSAAVWAPAHLHDEPLRAVHHAAVGGDRLTERARQPARLRHRQLARLRARAARHVGKRVRIGIRKTEAPERVVHAVDIVRANPAQDEVLPRGGSHRRVGEGARNPGEPAQPATREIAERHGHRDGDEVRLSLSADVGSTEPLAARIAECREEGRREPRTAWAVGGHERIELAERTSRIPRGRGRFTFVGFVRIEGEGRHESPARICASSWSTASRHTSQPSCLMRNFIRFFLRCSRSPLAWKTRRMASATAKISPAGRNAKSASAALTPQRRPATDRHAKAALRLAVSVARARVPTDVVDRREGVVHASAGEGDLELPWKRGAERVPQQEPGERLRVRRRIEQLVLRDAGSRARSDVPLGIDARLAS